MYFNDFGRIIVSKDLQNIKASSPMEVTPLGRVMDFKEEQ